jgi:hypothetical protein
VANCGLTAEKLLLSEAAVKTSPAVYVVTGMVLLS